MLKTFLQRKNISIYALSKECGISYSSLHYIVNGRTPYENCSVQVFKSIADALNVSMNELYEECQYTKDDFEIFKSNVGHRIKERGQLQFLQETLCSDIVEDYWNKDLRLPALYLVAMVDYLSRLNEIPICTKYHEYRSYRLTEPVYPMSYWAQKRFDVSYELENVIPEFERFGIMEGGIFDVE